jgi:hypothetical protein
MMNEEIDFEEFAPWLVIIITLVGGFLRLLLLGKKGCGWMKRSAYGWPAKVLQICCSGLSGSTNTHPFIILLLHYWIALNGDTPYYVRLLSVLFGAGTIPIIYLIGKRMSGAVMGLAAAVFLALSLFNIFFAQETRMYTLLTFNAAVAIYALVRLLTDSHALSGPSAVNFGNICMPGVPLGRLNQTPKKSSAIRMRPAINPDGGHGFSAIVGCPSSTIETDLAWIAFIVFSAATMLSHNTAVFFPLATNIFVLGLMLFQRIKKSKSPPGFQAPSIGNWVKAQIGIFCYGVHGSFPLSSKPASVYQRFWIPEPTWDSVIQVLKTFLIHPRRIPASQAMVIWILYVLVLGLGLVHFRKKFLILISGCPVCHPLPG